MFRYLVRTRKQGRNRSDAKRTLLDNRCYCCCFVFGATREIPLLRACSAGMCILRLFCGKPRKFPWQGTVFREHCAGCHGMPRQPAPMPTRADAYSNPRHATDGTRSPRRCQPAPMPMATHGTLPTAHHTACRANPLPCRGNPRKCP